MISLIVPTYNRAHTLARVAPSYYAQEGVTEIVFVLDGGRDNSLATIQALADCHRQVRTRVLRNPRRRGAAHCRNRGIQACTNEWVLFCDDDEYLEAGYAARLCEKLQALDAGAISGRRIYLRENETPARALQRFGNGLRNAPPFRRLLCEYVNGARFDGDLALPLVNANILTRRSLLQRFGFDDHYARGNGYREESDYQMNLYVHGYDLYMSNAVHSFHLPPSQVRSGGQRTSGLRRALWSIRHTAYFHRKYYAAYARRAGVHAPRALALSAFAGFAVYREVLRPTLYRAAMAVLDLRQRRTPAGAGAQG